MRGVTEASKTVTKMGAEELHSPMCNAGLGGQRQGPLCFECSSPDDKGYWLGLDQCVK